MNWFALLMTVGSMSRSLEKWVAHRIWLGWDRIWHCWNQTQKNIAITFKSSLKIKFLIFFICKKWVEAQISVSQSSWLMSNLACSRRLWRWVSFSKMLPSFIFIVVSISGNKFLFFLLLWEANLSGAPIKDATRWWGSGLHRKIDSSTRFEGLDTDIGTCFRI